jgi:hypothetical protein
MPFMRGHQRGNGAFLAGKELTFRMVSFRSDQPHGRHTLEINGTCAASITHILQRSTWLVKKHLCFETQLRQALPPRRLIDKSACAE